MRSLARALLAAVLAAVSLAQPTSAVPAAPAAVATGSWGVDDPGDAIPSLDEIKAALVALGAPQIDEFDLLDSSPLADLFDDGSRFVAIPTGDSNEVTITVGAFDVEDGADEQAGFRLALEELDAFVQRRGGSAGFKATEVAGSFGASEALDGVLVSQEGGVDKNLMVVRLARFGNTIVLVSTDTDLKTSPVTDDARMGMALINTVISKLVADNTK